MAKREEQAELVSLMDAAARLKLSYQRTRDLALRGVIPGLVRLSGRNFIERQALERYAKKVEREGEL
jgi:hypothetical protein